jgi:hypothetical protein
LEAITIKKLLSRPIHLPLPLFAAFGVLIILTGLAVVSALHSQTQSINFPAFAFTLLSLVVLALGAVMVPKLFDWMEKLHPAKMAEVTTTRRQAIRDANTRAGKWRASYKYLLLPLAIVVPILMSTGGMIALLAYYIALHILGQ